MIPSLKNAKDPQPRETAQWKSEAKSISEKRKKGSYHWQQDRTTHLMVVVALKKANGET